MESLPAATVCEWLQRVHSRFIELVPLLEAQFPDATFRTSSHPTGSLTAFQAHSVHLEASFPSHDSLAVSVCAAYLTTIPRVDASVDWTAEAPGGSEASTWEEPSSSTAWPLATADNLAHIDHDLPRLLDVFRSAIKRYLATGA